MTAKPGKSTVLIVDDDNMPGMDGLGVLRAIKKELPTTQAVMIGAEAAMERVKEAISSGTAGFIVKPFNAGRVLDDITAVLEKRGGKNG